MCRGIGANTDIQSLRRNLQNRKMWLLRGMQPFPAGSRSRSKHEIFQGKVKTLHWSWTGGGISSGPRAALPHLGFIVQSHISKSAFLKVRTDSGIPFHNMGPNFQLAEVSVSPTQQTYNQLRYVLLSLKMRTSSICLPSNSSQRRKAWILWIIPSQLYIHYFLYLFPTPGLRKWLQYYDIHTIKCIIFPSTAWLCQAGQLGSRRHMGCISACTRLERDN